MNSNNSNRRAYMRRYYERNRLVYLNQYRNNRQNQQHNRSSGSLFKAAIRGSENFSLPLRHNLGLMNKLCTHCKAVKYTNEKTHCCHNGKISLPEISAPFPNNLKSLFLQNDLRSKNFRDNIRQYNNANAFASMGANTVDIPGTGPYCFKISGQIYHRTNANIVINNMLNNQTFCNINQNTLPKYAELYVYDTDTSIEMRMRNQSNLHCTREIMGLISEDIQTVSPYAAHYKNLRSQYNEEHQRIITNGGVMRQITLTFNRNINDDRRTYNVPTTTNEIGAVYVMDRDGNLPGIIDFAVSPINTVTNSLQRLHFLSKHVDPMVFVLFFPRGDFGFTSNTPHTAAQATSLRNTMTHLQYYAYRIAIRRDHFNPLHFGGKLFQEFLVHAYCIYEANKINFIRNNQALFRVESYSGIMDHLNDMGRNLQVPVGNIVILPSSYYGGPRFMNCLYQNNMSIVRKFGRPDLFITFTCNPKWNEIQAELHPFQSGADRPDLVTRIFNAKLKQFIQDIIKNKIFGNVIAYVYVIEHQKRGLPHAHCVFTLSQADKIKTSDDIDSIISAEIPNKESEPNLYEVILKHNIHGPCNVRCMHDGHCSKKFPQSFRDTTDAGVDGYPKYKRSDNSLENHRTAQNFLIDNRWVVPYNPFLSMKYDAHINVELCSTVKAIKYLHKYIRKGSDCARISLNNDQGQVLIHDEPTGYLNCRYVSAQEACWRLQEFPIHGHSHSIFQLAIHVKNGQAIYFRENEEEEALRIANTTSTSLTAYFHLNCNDPTAHEYYYQDIPVYYKFENKKWKRRSANSSFGEMTIGRIPSVSPRNMELYHLRLLLLSVKGEDCTSFEKLLLFENRTYATYRDVCRARGLINDNDEWHNCLMQAINDAMPYALRSLFIIIIVYNNPVDPLKLWEDFKEYLSEDFLHQGYDTETAISICLSEIDKQLIKEGSCCSKVGLPIPTPVNFQNMQNENINVAPVSMWENLNTQQLLAAKEIYKAVILNAPQKYFYIDGPGGSGKTYLYGALIEKLRNEGKKVLPLAWTGIAANLLDNGMTCHSAFNLSLDLSSVQSPRLTAVKKQFLKAIDLFIWDEAPMAPGTALESVDLLLKDITGNKNIPFGGKVIVMGGDFRQVLPVIHRGSRGKIVASTIKKSVLWTHFKHFSLLTNMRSSEDLQFSEWLLKLGNGFLEYLPHSTSGNSVEIPQQFISSSLIDDIFGDHFTSADAKNFSKRAILTPKNEYVRFINEKVLGKLQGESKTYCAIDCIKNAEGEIDNDEQVNFPVEFLNSLNPSGLPPHKLNLKLGSIVMLLRNLSISKGLCNGTRMIVRDLRPNLIKVEIITGSQSGDIHFIPRISLDTANDPSLPFTFSRHQFPLRLAYGITINKAQGQTFEKVGLFLPEPCFGHGQLYTACSRATQGCCLKIQVIDGLRQGKTSENKILTDNIVYREVL